MSPSTTGKATRRLGGEPWLIAFASLAVMVAAIGGFAVLLNGVLGSAGLAPLDLPAVEYLADHRGRALLIACRGITTLGIPVVTIILAAGVCGWLAWRQRSLAPLMIGAVAVGGVGGIDVGVKHVVARPRPPMELHAVTVAGYSFPSGHAIFSALVIVLCAGMVDYWVLVRPGPRLGLWVGAVAVITVIGFSRVYLGVHYPSDVLAGWALAAAWAVALRSSAWIWARRRLAPAAHEDRALELSAPQP